MRAPHLSDIRFYPVKGLRGIPVPQRAVEPWGLAGDRRWMIVDRDGVFVSQRTLPPLAVIGASPTADGGLLLTAAGHEPLAVPPPDAGAGSEAVTTVVWRSAVPALAAGDTADAWFGAVLGIRCRLVYMADPASRPVSPDFGGPDDRVSFADGYPVLLTTTASLAELNRRLAEPVPMERFRPNLVIDGVGQPFAEDRWRRVRVGGAVFRVVKPCARCAVTTVDQQTGERMGTEPLRTLATFRRAASGGVLFGANLIPDGGVGEVRIGDGFEVLEIAPAPDPQFAIVDAD